MGNISDVAEQVATGSKQVSDSSQTLSQGSSEQAGSVQELSGQAEILKEMVSRFRLNKGIRTLPDGGPGLLPDGSKMANKSVYAAPSKIVLDEEHDKY